jgi:hypothetical protein
LIDQSLQRERALTRIRGSDQGFRDLHGRQRTPVPYRISVTEP